MNEYELYDKQIPAVNAFIDIYGVDVGTEMLFNFQAQGSLGKAMIETVKKLKCEHDNVRITEGGLRQCNECRAMLDKKEGESGDLV